MPKSLKEIDKKTLHSYKSKAELANAGNSKNAAANDKMAKKAAAKGDSESAMGHLERAKTKRLSIQKRTKGLEMANKKLGEGTYNTFSMKKVDKYDIPKRGLSPAEKRDKEDIVKGMKNNKTDFMKRYGRDHEAVMHATATKLAKQNEEKITELDKDTLKSYVGKAQAKRLDNIDKFQKKLREAEFDADKPKRGIQRKRVNLQFGRQQRHNPTPFKKDQQQDLYKKSDPIEKKIRKSRENKRFPDYRQDKDTGIIKKDFLPGGEHAKKYGGLQNKKTKPNVTATTEDRVINQLKILIKENFQDGSNPKDKGDAKRHGLSGKQSSSSLKKVRSSDSASPRKKQLAHWILNMRKGRNKKK